MTHHLNDPPPLRMGICTVSTYYFVFLMVPLFESLHADVKLAVTVTDVDVVSTVTASRPGRRGRVVVCRRGFLP